MPYKFEDKLVEVKQISSGMHHSVLLSKDGNKTTIEKRFLFVFRRCIHHWMWWLRTSWSRREGNAPRKRRFEKSHHRQENCFRRKRKVISRGWSSFDSFFSCCTYAVAEDGSGYAWGMGSNLQLTNGSEEDEWEPVQVTGKQIEGQKVSSAYFRRIFYRLNRTLWVLELLK